MDPVTEKVFLDKGLLSEILSFLPRPCELDPVCKAIRDVMHDVGKYRIKFSNKYRYRLEVARTRVKNQFIQITPSFFETEDCRFEDHVTDLHHFRAVEIDLFNWDTNVPSTLLSFKSNLVNLSIFWKTPEISDWSFLGSFTKLQHLSFCDFRITDISIIANLTGLKLLRLSRCPISDLSPIQNLTSLEDLDFSHTFVSCILPLRRLAHLEVLRFFGTRVACVDSLTELQSITSLHFTILDVAACVFLPVLTRLRQVTLRSQSRFFNQRDEFDFSEGAVQGRSNIQDMKVLQKIVGVEYISIPNFWNRLVSLDGLQNATKLRFLDISRSHVVEVSALRALHALEDLNAFFTRISDVSPLCSLSSLRALCLKRTRVTDVKCLECCASLRRLEIPGRAEGYETLILRGVSVDKGSL